MRVTLSDPIVEVQSGVLLSRKKAAIKNQRSFSNIYIERERGDFFSR